MRDESHSDNHKKGSNPFFFRGVNFNKNPGNSLYEPEANSSQNESDIQINATLKDERVIQQRPREHVSNALVAIANSLSALISLGTLVGLIFTVRLADRQWQEMNAQTRKAAEALAETKRANASNSLDSQNAFDLSRDALVDVQRAFVTFDTRFITIASDPSQINSRGIEPQVLWQNTGTTPTKNLTMNSSYDYLPGGLPDNFKFPDLGSNPPFREYLGPKAQIVADRVTVPMAKEEEMADGKNRLFMWGWATYHDVFSKTDLHISKFCVEIKIEKIKGPGGAEALKTDTEYCRKNNCVDEECKASKAKVRRVGKFNHLLSR